MRTVNVNRIPNDCKAVLTAIRGERANMKIRENRIMSKIDLRNLCVKFNWFTRATNEEYDKFLNLVNANMTANRLLIMALEIQKYSDPETYDQLESSDIVYTLCEICHSCFTVTDE